MPDIESISRRLDIRYGETFESHLPDNVIWEEDPVGFREFCENPVHLGAFALSDRQYSDVRELIGDDPKLLFSPSRKRTTLILVYGKGGGKDEVASRLALYNIYVLLCMHNPQEFLFGGKSSASLDIINVARKEKQAAQVFFTYFRNHLLRSRWFKDHFDIEYKRQYESRVTRRNRYRGKIIVKKDGAEFPKNIRCVSESTENETWEGYNVVFFILDEISGFVSPNEVLLGWRIYKTARTSCTSRATKNFKGMGVVMSFPRQEEGDITLDLLKQSYHVPYMYGSLCYTWQAKGAAVYSGKSFVFRHPRIDSHLDVEGAGIEVPMELFEDFDQDPDDSITKYLCLPPRTAGAWIEYPDRVLDCVAHGRQKLFKTEEYIDHVTDVATGRIIKLVNKRIVECSVKSPEERFRPRVAWLDAAEKECDAVLVIAHIEHKPMPTPDGEVEMVEVVVIDDELIWRPSRTLGNQVSLDNIEYIVNQVLPKYIRLVAVGADQWNSATFLERLRRKGVKAIGRNLSQDDYTLLKRKIYMNHIQLLDSEGYQQLLSLVNAGGNQKPRKKPGFFQDIADAICGTVHLLAGVEKHKGQFSRSRGAQPGMPRGTTGGMRPGRQQSASPTPNVPLNVPSTPGSPSTPAGVHHRPIPGGYQPSRPVSTTSTEPSISRLPKSVKL